MRFLASGRSTADSIDDVEFSARLALAIAVNAALALLIAAFAASCEPTRLRMVGGRGSISASRCSICPRP